MTSALTLFHIEPDLAAAEMLRDRIVQSMNLQYLGAAATGAQGMAACRDLEPDLVLIELQLRDMDGFDLIDDLAQLAKKPRVILFTVRTDEFMLYLSQFVAISGIVWKTGGGLGDLFAAIAEVGAGGSFFPPEYKRAARDLEAHGDAFFKVLTKKEQELIPHFGRGATDEAIARHFEVKPGTIHAQRQSVMGKLNLHRREDLMRWALEKGFIHIPSSAAPCVLAFR